MRNYEKPISEFPSMENLLVDTNYAFTISLSKEYQYFNELAETRLDKVIRRTVSLLKQHPYIHFTIYPEVSTLSANVHFHGTISTDNKFYFYMYFVHRFKDKASITVKPLNDPEEWEKYCLKNKETMKPIVEDDEIGMLYRITDKTNKQITKYVDEVNILDYMKTFK